MIDKDMLELAAKAADMDVEYMEGMGFLHCFNEYDKVWNPLTDDGDALRLAVKLKMDIMLEFDRIDVTAQGGAATKYLYDLPIPTDPYAATRRAIVRAAAEIGRTL